MQCAVFDFYAAPPLFMIIYQVVHENNNNNNRKSMTTCSAHDFFIFIDRSGVVVRGIYGSHQQLMITARQKIFHEVVSPPGYSYTRLNVGNLIIYIC
mmetsp:Transcript_37972/g.59044  ORF Transcript_37972/g.59044 Transcript_37972/m.59044 type:complete len:97 (+) Transcript_37972:62-352(+)